MNAHGAVATGINGLDGNLFVARPKDERLGFVGDVTEINPGLIRSLQSEGYVPVVAPLARGGDGKTYNLNADTAAAALASELGARKLVYLTDVEGLYRDLGDEDSLLSRAVVPSSRKCSPARECPPGCARSCRAPSTPSRAASIESTFSTAGCSMLFSSRSSPLRGSEP